MQYKFAYAALGALLIADPVSAQQSPQSNTVAPKPAPQPKTYCFQFSLDTGSRINRMECRTRKQWEMLGVDVDNPNGK